MVTHLLTHLFTDLENSSFLWEQFPNEMRPALARHDDLMKQAVESHHGRIVKTTGDGLHAVFESPSDAVSATLTGQRAIIAEAWPAKTGSLKIRMGLHTGQSQERDGDYYGGEVNRAARIMAIANGGQILLSSITAALAREHLPSGTTLLDLGEHRLKNINRPENVFQLNAPGLPQDFPPLKSSYSSPNNLPTQLTSFIGRDKEMAEINAMLKSGRLVTLTGTGGTGKTRLSIEIGIARLSSFPDGIWLIELASLTDPDQIIPAMAQVFGLQEFPNMPLATQVANYLSDKKSLLILDNCEHLIEACARLADDLLHQCIGLEILASSREALGIAGEIAYSIPPLADSESMQLFIERARAVNPGFDLKDSSAIAITKICTRLDGIPLAIELAAARAKLLTPEQISTRLDDRFRLLVSGSRTALPRQQTLRALIDWSYDLLSEEEKTLLQTVSVFVGGWTLAAVEFVSGDPFVLENLEQLVNKSLVRTEEQGSEMRFSMLETIRQYAHEKLFDAKRVVEVRNRHFTYFDNLSENLWEAFRTSNILIWRDKADYEAENLRTALEWGLENHVEKAIHLATNFCFIADWLGLQSLGLSLVKIAIEKTRSLPPADEKAKIYHQNLIARALFAQGLNELNSGNMALSIEILQEAVSIARAVSNRLILGYSLGILFIGPTFMNLPGAEEAAQEALTIFTEEIDDSWGLSVAYQNMARVAASKGDHEGTQRYFAKFNEMRRKAPYSTHNGWFLMGLGMSESAQGNYQIAKQLFEDALDVFKRVRIKNFQLVVKSELGHIARRTGNLNQAKSTYTETIRGWKELGNRHAVAHQLECFAFIAIAEKQPQRAQKLFGAAEALRKSINSSMVDLEQLEYDQVVAQVRSMINQADAEAYWVEGGAMTMEQSIQFALEGNLI